jgi:hypothetical protein
MKDISVAAQGSGLVSLITWQSLPDIIVTSEGKIRDLNEMSGLYERYLAR